MGLDQYAYAVYPHPENTSTNIGWPRGAETDDHTNGYVNRTESLFIIKNIDEFTNLSQTKLAEPAMIVDGPNISNPVVEFAYWRKHPNLQGWMEKLYLSKSSGVPGQFNCQPIEITLTDIEQLETVINRGELPPTSGFFFGDDSDEYYKEKDLEFINKAKKYLNLGMQVYYDSWW